MCINPQNQQLFTVFAENYQDLALKQYSENNQTWKNPVSSSSIVKERTLVIQIGNIKRHEKQLLRFTLPIVRRSLNVTANYFARKNVPESIGEARDKNHSGRLFIWYNNQELKKLFIIKFWQKKQGQFFHLWLPILRHQHLSASVEQDRVFLLSIFPSDFLGPTGCKLSVPAFYHVIWVLVSQRSSSVWWVEQGGCWSNSDHLANKQSCRRSPNIATSVVLFRFVLVPDSAFGSNTDGKKYYINGACVVQGRVLSLAFFFPIAPNLDTPHSIPVRICLKVLRQDCPAWQLLLGLDSGNWDATSTVSDFKTTIFASDFSHYLVNRLAQV